jgi:hypothetical protein
VVFLPLPETSVLAHRMRERTAEPPVSQLLRIARQGCDGPAQILHPTRARRGSRLGLGRGRSCLQDSRELSAACWQVLSWQLKSGGPSSQCAPDGLNDAWWNDNRNDKAHPGHSCYWPPTAWKTRWV